MTWDRSDAQVIRDMINHESEVTNHRLTWLATLHGLLFAALGFTWKDGRELIWLLAVLGIATSLSILVPLGFASSASRTLFELWEENKPEDYNGPPVIGRGPVGPLASLFFPWFLLPVLLAVAWIVVAALNYCR